MIAIPLNTKKSTIILKLNTNASISRHTMASMQISEVDIELNTTCALNKLFRNHSKEKQLEMIDENIRIYII